MKKVLMTVAALAVAASLFAAKKEGKVFNIYCWNEEFQSRFKDYFEKAGKVPAGIKINWIITPTADNAYQNRLDEALLQQKKAAKDDKIDMFLVEADYALKYVDTPYTLDVKKDIGIKDADLAQQYKYTKDVMTDGKGKLKGVSWQACPGGLVYRRSYAKEVLGTDDPAQVQEKLSDWSKFDAVAAQMKDAGYFMLSGFDDAYRTFSDNIKAPCVDKKGKIVVDPEIKAWVKQTKEYTEKGYNNKANLWSAESGNGSKKDGKVFCYFGPGWFIDFCLAGWTMDNPDGPKEAGNGSYGDWALCEGPRGFSWGGTWICGAAGSDNISLIKSIMETMTCDKATLTKIAKETGDFTNNVQAMTEVSASNYKNTFLGGQNHLGLLLKNAQKINKNTISPYDQGFTEKLMASMADYYNGKVSEEKAWDNFYKAMLETYPNLKR